MNLTLKFSAEQVIAVLNEVGSDEFDGVDDGSDLVDAEVEKIEDVDIWW